MLPTNRIRRYLPPLLILLPVIFICGKLLLTPVNVDGNNDDVESTYGQGWPWEFHNYKEAKPGWQVVHEITPWPMFSWWLLLADIGVLLLLFGIAVILLAIHYRRRGAWFRFSLFELIGCMTLVALAAGGFHRSEIQRRQEVDLISKCGDDNAAQATFEYTGPRWLRRFLPDDKLHGFDRITELSVYKYSFPRQSRIELADLVRQLPSLRMLCLGNEPEYAAAEPSTDGWRSADEVPTIIISRPEGYAQLERLEIEYDGVRDETLPALAKMSNLRYLVIEKSFRISDDGLEALSKIANLEELVMHGCNKITVVGVRRLLAMPTLKSLWLRGWSRESSAMRDIESLRRDHPQLFIDY